MTAHVVKQGECLSSIAARHGLTWRQLWEDPANATLRQRRKDPHVLHPGDEVTIPAPAPPRAALALDKVTTIVRRRRGHRPLVLHVVDSADAPIRDAEYRLTFEGGAALTGRTDERGVLRTELPVEVEEAELEVGAWRFPLLIGHLNPLEDVTDDGLSGAQGRLANLGYDPGPADGAMGPRTAAALRAFQHAEGLDVTGALDGPTRERLRARHGR